MGQGASFKPRAVERIFVSRRADESPPPFVSPVSAEHQQLRSDARPLRHLEFYQAVIKRYPDVLTWSMYKQPRLDKPLHIMTREERNRLFRAGLHDMMHSILQGRPVDEVAYDHTAPRLWSFALQGTWEVKADRSEASLQCLESLIAVHCGSWGIGLVLECVQDLLADDLEQYMLWKGLEIRAAVAFLRRHPHMPSIAVNLRPVEFMQKRIQDVVLDAAKQVGPRIAFELTEYTGDVHFARLFGTEGSLRERLDAKLLPVLRSLKEAGVVLVADDLKPLDVYSFEDEGSFKNGVTLESSHATSCDVMLSEEWLSLFHRVKFSTDWMIHTFHCSADTGDDYAKVPIYSFHVKDKPSYVAAVTGSPAPQSEAGEAAALEELQRKAQEAARRSLPKAMACPLGPVFEVTIPRAAISEWGLGPSAGEQGGLLFEAKFPPSWYLGDIVEACDDS